MKVAVTMEKLQQIVYYAVSYTHLDVYKRQEENAEPSLSGFLEEISLYTDIDKYDPTADNVILMTMHSAKGLEFPYVFIAGMEEGIFPGVQSMYDPAQVEEERRLAYVSLTRAKKQLYISTASQRMLFGQTMRNRPKCVELLL